jgi:hypothetical protein
VAAFDAVGVVECAVGGDEAHAVTSTLARRAKKTGVLRFMLIRRHAQRSGSTPRVPKVREAACARDLVDTEPPDRVVNDLAVSEEKA